MINGLLEHLPGDVPFSTHLGLENARSRLVQRALLEGHEPEPNRSWDAPARHDTSAPGCEKGGAASSPPAEPVRLVAVERVRAVRLYEQRRERWPLGGLIDLVV